MSALPPIVQVGVDHRSAALDLVERCHGRPAEAGAVPGLPSGAGAVGLTTCHRVELYLEGMTVDAARRLFRGWSGAGDEISLPDRALAVRTGDDAARHLIRVAAGLESAVLGEDQILQQVRHAYREACAAKTAGPCLHRLFHASFRAGKRVRTETALASGSRSLAGAAVVMTQRFLGRLAGKSVLVLGTGEMGALAARRLKSRGLDNLLICNRTSSRAQNLAARLDAGALPWEWRRGALDRVDGVICATGAPEPVIEASWLSAACARRRSPLVVVDLAVPRNVERPADCPSLTLIDVEVLSRKLEEENRTRQRAVEAATAIVEADLREWLDWVDRRESHRQAAGTCRRRRELTAG